MPLDMSILIAIVMSLDVVIILAIDMVIAVAIVIALAFAGSFPVGVVTCAAAATTGAVTGAVTAMRMVESQVYLAELAARDTAIWLAQREVARAAVDNADNADNADEDAYMLELRNDLATAPTIGVGECPICLGDDLPIIPVCVTRHAGHSCCRTCAAMITKCHMCRDRMLIQLSGVMNV